MPPILHRIRRQVGMTPLRGLLVRWRHRVVGADDVFLASYPRSGNTWIKHLLVYLLTGNEHSFYGHKDPMIPGVGRMKGHFLQTGRGRILKTHEPYWDGYRQALYLVRDGRDVAVSQYWYLLRQGGGPQDFDRFLDLFLRGRVGPFGSWQGNVRSWMSCGLEKDSQLLVVRYEDLLRDGLQTLNKICSFLRIEASGETLDRTMQANTFEAMKKREEQSKHIAKVQGKTRIPVVRNGKKDAWQDVFSKAQLDRFQQAAGEVLDELGYQS